MEDEITPLIKLIKNNPPLREEGYRYFGREGWLEEFDKKISHWRQLLQDISTWQQMKNVRPLGDYEGLLKALLPYSPLEILIQYLRSIEDEEKDVALETILEDNGKKLTPNLWKLLDKGTKKGIIFEIINRIRRRTRIFDYVDSLIHRQTFPLEQNDLNSLYLASLGAAFDEPLETTNPLWINLKEIVRDSNDTYSSRIIKEFENQSKKKLERETRRLKLVLPQFQKLTKDTDRGRTNNIMFDPSLLLDFEHLRKAIKFMKEHQREFKFYSQVFLFAYISK